MKAKSYLMFGVVILISILVGLLISQVSARLDPLRKLLNLFGLGPQGLTVIEHDTIIDKIEQVSELTTTKYNIQLVVTSEYGGTFAGTGNFKLALIAKGRVEAGLDLKKLDPSTVKVSDDGQSVTVNLPPVKILNRDSILIDDPDEPKDTYVWVLSRAFGADTSGAEQTLRANAANQVLEAACKDGILEQATKDAKSAIEQLLKTFVPNVKVLSEPVPSLDACTGK